MRAATQLLSTILPPPSDAQMYVAEQVTPLFSLLKTRYSRLTGSEYLGQDIAKGQSDRNGIRNEDLTALSFRNAQFDVVLSFDVFEHVPNFESAFAECARALKPSGFMLFSVPFDLHAEHNLIRARLLPDGSIHHLLEPEYHGNPLSPEGSLAFQCFGWEMLDQVRNAGFAAAFALLYWSRDLGYRKRETSDVLGREVKLRPVEI
jgi:SAM-dependent methyltransferase